jgi:hypothetical protein
VGEQNTEKYSCTVDIMDPEHNAYSSQNNAYISDLETEDEGYEDFRTEEQECKEKEKNWHEGEVEPYNVETEREKHIEQWKKRGLWDEAESSKYIEDNTKREKPENESEEKGETSKAKKRVQWKEEVDKKETEIRQLIDNILPTTGRKHKDCIYPCGVSDSDTRLPTISDNSSSDDEEEREFECEATGFKATERQWKKISAHNKKWERQYKLLKEEHDNIMHAPTVTGEEMAIVMDCFRQSTKMERVRYEAEKKKMTTLEYTAHN